jgi:hypothetical protein
MGTQQLLLIIAGVIIVGVAIAVGITMFGADNISSNKDGLISDLQNLAADAANFRTRPTTMGGGSGSYTGYAVPTKMQTNEDGSFSATASAQTITFVGTSALGYGTITAVCDSSGQLGGYTYTGQLQ